MEFSNKNNVKIFLGLPNKYYSDIDAIGRRGFGFVLIIN